MKRILRIFCALWLLATPALAQSHCVNRSFEGHSYTLCTAHISEDLRLFWGEEDKAFGHFSSLNSALKAEGKELVFAMNAGMFAKNLSPLGHYVELGVTTRKVITKGSSFNFGMLPNGVFCINEDGFDVIETKRFVSRAPKCAFATQSGPMLVIDGELHPRFIPNSTSRYVRNGVGVSDDKTQAYFVISNRPINFHSFARIFQEGLKVRQALFFDGNVSRLYAGELGRNDFGRAVGPIVGLVQDKLQ